MKRHSKKLYGQIFVIYFQIMEKRLSYKFCIKKINAIFMHFFKISICLPLYSKNEFCVNRGVRNIQNTPNMQPKWKIVDFP